MAEKVTIAQLDIDADALLKQATATKAAIDAIKDSNKQLKKSTEDTTAEQVKNEVALKNLSSEYNNQKKLLTALNDEGKNFITTQKAATKAVDQEIKSINQARENNKQLLKIRNELNLSTKAGRDALTQINGKLDDNNKFIKDNADAYTKQKLNIGNYKSALDGVSPVLGDIAGTLIQVKEGLLAQAAAMRASSVATGGTSKALRIFKLALISTGIGAIVVALGSLIAFLSTTQQGIDAVTKVTRPLQAIFSSLVGVVQDLGGILFTAFTSPQKALDQLFEKFSSLGKIIEGVVTFDFDKIKEGVLEAAASVSTFLGEAVDKGLEIDRIQKSIEQTEINLTRQRGKSNLIIKEQNKLAEDTTKSLQVRQEAARLAIEESQKLLKFEQDIIDLKIQKAEIEQSLNDTNREDNLELAQLEAERDEKATAAAELQTTLQNKLNTIRAEGARKSKAAADAELKILEEENKKAEEKAKKTEQDREKELERVRQFEERKRSLLNDIALAQEEEEQAKEELKVQQELEKNLLDLENLQLTEEEKIELKALLLEQEELRLKEIRDKFQEEKEKKQKADFKAELDRRKKLNNEIIEGAVNLVGQQTKLGQALIAIRGVLAAKETLIELGLVKNRIAASTANATASVAEGTAQTAKVGFPQNIPLLIGFAAQVAGIIGAIKGAAGASKNISTPRFYEGGKVPYGSGGRITGQNIPTQRGGDNILATVKSGEVILNNEQQQRAGGGAFFKSIGVPGFQTGGLVGATTSSVSNAVNNTVDFEGLATAIATKINDIKIVAIEEDITGAQTTKVEIVNGARI